MLTSIPSLAVELGMGFIEYAKIARNIRRISLISKERRQEILDKANRELPSEIITKGKTLVEKMTYDREVYKIAGFDYGEGPPKGEDLFTTAIADYLLRNKGKFEAQFF